MDTLVYVALVGIPTRLWEQKENLLFNIKIQTATTESYFHFLSQEL